MSNGPILTNQKVHLKKTTKLFLLNAELPIYMIHYSFSLLYFSKQYFFFLNIIIKPQFLILLILFIIDSLIKNELIIFNFFRLLLFYDERHQKQVIGDVGFIMVFSNYNFLSNGQQHHFLEYKEIYIQMIYWLIKYHQMRAA